VPVDFNFHTPTEPLTLTSMAKAGDFSLPDAFRPDKPIDAICQADEPVLGGLTFVDRAKAKKLAAGLADCAAVLCKSSDVDILVAAGIDAIPTDHPKAAFQDALTVLFAKSLGNSPVIADEENVTILANGASVSRTAELEEDVHVGRGAVIGDGVQIGRGTRIGANTVVARRCKIGRECDIGDNASIQYAMIGDSVVLAPGVRIGQEGFGFVPRADGLKKMPQLGRVILQDKVEIGSNTTIDRGTLGDTSVGQGTKIDNLVQIGHNVQIGVSTVIAGHVGVSGSSRIGNFCMLGGGVGIADHLTIGDGVQLAAASKLMNDIPAGERWGGVPAVPMQEAIRQYAALRKLTASSKKKAQ